MSQDQFYTSNAAARASNITKFEIFSNYGKKLDVSLGSIQFQYFESVLDTTVRATATIVDTGNTTDDVPSGILEDEGLKITGGEKAHFEVEDNYGTKLTFSDDTQLRVKSIRNIMEDTRQVIFTLDFYSQECINDRLEEYRVKKRYDGKPSDHVEKILKQVLKTSKNVDIDTTINDFNFTGGHRNELDRPLNKCTILATYSVPDLPRAKGNLAGYLFYETHQGYKFKSIDNLLKQKPKKKYIFTDTTSFPPDYDGKILQYDFESIIDVEKSLMTGSLFQTQLRATNFYDNRPRKNEVSHTQQENEDTIAGLEHPRIATDLDAQNKVAKVITRYDRRGVLPSGTTLEEQLKKSKDNDFSLDDIVRQANMRINQLFSNRLTITIPGDFSLQAGDVIYCDLPELSSKKMQVVSQKKSGLYMIADLSHLITVNKTFTKLNLVRESIGRKPF
jgi:hypothetical protein